MLIWPVAAQAQLTAFPGAEGEGMYTTGGRGGEIYHVTNLNDSGPGSLRTGMATATGTPRTIVFDVGGTIALDETVSMSNPNVTIAGQTAPGQGITLVNFGMLVDRDNTIVRHIRVRPGDARKGPGEGYYSGDALGVWGSHIVVDHVSTSWSIDELLSCAASGFHDVTVQYCSISEGLDQTGLIHGQIDHSNDPGGTNHHAMGTLIKPVAGDGVASYHHNLWSQNFKRCAAIGAYGASSFVKADIRNNVLYNNLNNGYNSGDSGRTDINWVGNYMVAGPITSSTWLTKHFSSSSTAVHFYQFDNMSDGDKDLVHDGVAVTTNVIGGTCTPELAPWANRPITTQTAEEAYTDVLANVGAFPWARDSVDIRLIGYVTTQGGGLIDSQSEVGGYPVIPAVARPAGWDTDSDGMPNYWETWYGTNPDAGDQNGLSASGYTHLERYLEWLLNPSTIMPTFHWGDANADGLVDVGDLGILAMNWMGTGGYGQANFNGDGIIDVGDLGILAFNWNWTYLNQPIPPESEAGLAGVPEPTTLLLIGLGVALGIRRKKA